MPSTRTTSTCTDSLPTAIVFIEYDLDNTFGIDWFGVDWTSRNLNNWHESNRPLVERLLDVPYYKDVFNAYLDTLLTDLDTSSLGTVLENKQDLIKGAVLSDTYYRKDYGFQYADFLAALDDNYGAHVKTGLLEYLDGGLLAAKDRCSGSEI